MAVSIASLSNLGSLVLGLVLLFLTGLVSMIRVLLEDCMMQLSSSVTSSLSLAGALDLSH